MSSLDECIGQRLYLRKDCGVFKMCRGDTRRAGKVKVRIFECTDSLLPVVDGVGRVVDQYCRNLAARGHEVYAICPMSDTGYRGALPYEIVDFASTLRMPKTPQYKAGVAGFDTHYKKRVEMLRPQIVHVHSPVSAGWEGVRLARKWGVPLVGTFHSKYYDDMYYMTRSRAIAHMGASAIGEFFASCDEVWTVSQYAARELRSYGCDVPIRIVRNGVNPSFAQPLARERVESFLGIAPQEPLFLYVGQIDRKKNLALILEACAVLKARGASFRMAFAGQGRDRTRFEKQARELGLAGTVIFTGHVRDAHLLAGLYTRALLFVFVSTYDTAGLVVGEAASVNTPSVALSDSAPAEIIRDGENGFLCQETAQSLADAMQRALENPRMVQNMGLCAAQTLPLPWDGVIDQVEQSYRQLIRQGRRPRRNLVQKMVDGMQKKTDEKDTEE